MSLESQVASHYGSSDLEQRILKALAASGKDLAKLDHVDLAPVDEFHIGGREATMALMAQLPITPAMQLLDIGCGIGGPARYVAAQHDCHVIGIDLTPRFIEVGRSLTARVGLADRVALRQGTALELPFDAARFDGAYMLHVGMNIADKAQLIAEVARVLRPGGWFAIYDVMRLADGAITWPVPWSPGPETSFVASPEQYRTCLEAAGFTVQAERERRRYAIDFLEAGLARARSAEPPVLGPPLIMGPEFPIKIGNLLEAMARGVIGPVELISRAGAAAG